MKRRLLPLMAGVILIALISGLIGCARPAAPPAEKILLRVTTEVAAPISRAVALDYFKKIVDERLGNRVDCRVYTGGSLYKDAQALDALGTKELEMSFILAFLFIKVNKQITAAYIPGLAYEGDRRDWFDTPSMEATLAEIEGKGISVVGWGTSSWAGIATKKRVLLPADVKGLKLRHYDPLAGAIVSTDIWGAPAIFMSFADVPSSLASGIIDGCHTSIEGWSTIRDAAPYFIIQASPGELEAAFAFIASAQWWKALPQDLRDKLQKCVDDTCKFQRDLAIKDNIDFLQKFGVPGIDPTKAGTGDPTKPGAYRLTPAQTDEWYKLVYLNLKKFIPIYGEQTVKDMAVFQKKTLKRMGIWDQVKTDLGITE